ncbi:MAG: hypothetical protein Q7K26_02110 [bacterium]|nr:hypothetical protein [bacterium]
MKSKTRKNLLPVDIKLPERLLFNGGVIFATLRTLEELEQFWREHQFQFACGGRYWGEEPSFLREYQWIFGMSKSSVVRTALRWEELGIACEFYEDPEIIAGWFHDRDEYRANQVKNGDWTDLDEKEYQADCIRRSPETYHGWWQLKNLPGVLDLSSWLNSFTDHEELIDPNMPVAEVERTLQEQTFDDWKNLDCEDIQCHDRISFEEMIAYWRQEQTASEDYYGKENEGIV